MAVVHVKFLPPFPQPDMHLRIVGLMPTTAGIGLGRRTGSPVAYREVNDFYLPFPGYLVALQ